MIRGKNVKQLCEVNMNIKYEANGCMKVADEDIWKRGCTSFADITQCGENVFSADTVLELIEELKKFCGTEDDTALLLDACDETGRLDIQVMENEDGISASKKEIEWWQHKKTKLWLCCYTFYIVKVTREEVCLAEFNQACEKQGEA